MHKKHIDFPKRKCVFSSLLLCLVVVAIGGRAVSAHSCTPNRYGHGHGNHGPSLPMIILLTSSITVRNIEAFSWWRRFSSQQSRLKIIKELGSSGTATTTSSDGSTFGTEGDLDVDAIKSWNNRSSASFVGRGQGRRRGQGRSPKMFASVYSNVALHVRTEDTDMEVEAAETNVAAARTITTEVQKLDADKDIISNKKSNSIPAQTETRTQTHVCDNSNNSTSSKSECTLHTFHYPVANITLHGLRVSLPQFRAWVLYNLQNLEQGSDSEEIPIEKYLSSRTIRASDPNVRMDLRDLWFSRMLICDRTEVLAVYPSEKRTRTRTNAKKEVKDSIADKSVTKKKVKRGGFEDLLTLYCERLVGILKDESNDSNDNDKERSQSQAEDSSSSFHMRTWVEDNYGKRRTEQLRIETFKKLPFIQQKNALLHLLHWFKENYPYYYDKCDECGASYRDDSKDNDAGQDQEVDDAKLADDDDIHAGLKGSFLGYCYPNRRELDGRAARTEMYQCHSCGEYTRFPRYNNAKQIVENGGRGRCGEYSILLYRILRSLGHETRWVVDWADHVWAEVYFDDRWIHLDPCEAAFDHPLLYEEWGKKQTYIFAFWMPLQPFNRMAAKFTAVEEENPQSTFPFVQDVTENYTSDSQEAILVRRGKEKSHEIIVKATDKLMQSFHEVNF